MVVLPIYCTVILVGYLLVAPSFLDLLPVRTDRNTHKVDPLPRSRPVSPCSQDESFETNVARLKEYRSKLIIFPRKGKKGLKEGEASSEEMKSVQKVTDHSRDRRLVATGLEKGCSLPYFWCAWYSVLSNNSPPTLLIM